MAKKNNIRSIRFSDELAELIDRQVGDTFTEKFENLITQCVWTLPGKKAQIKKLDEEIQRKQRQYKEMCDKVTELRRTLTKLETVIISETMNWDKKM